MKKNLKSHKRILTMLLSFILAIGVGGWIAYANPFESFASYDKDKAITFGEFNQKTPVADKYFFVGTYLFSLDVITDEIYEKALASQSEMNQFNVFYKSELAGGVWFDIADAADLSDITTNGTKVDEKELNKLYVTIYIDENGRSFDAKTMAAKSLYDDPNPYDLTKIPELNTLFSQYKSSFNEDSKGVNLFYFEQLTSFFAMDPRNLPGVREETDKLDRRLGNLQTAYESLQGEKKAEEAEAVQKLMQRVDNARRAIIYKKLAIGDEKNELEKYELNKLSMVLSNRSDWGVGNIEDEEEIEQSTLPYDIWTNEKKQYTYDQLYEYIVNHDGLVEVKDPDDDDDDEEDEEDEEDENVPKVLPDIRSFFKDTRFEGAAANKEEFKINDGIISTINEADSDCKKAYDKYTSESLASPDSHVGNATYRREEAIFEQAESGYSADMALKIDELISVNNIATNVVKEKEKELAIIQSELLTNSESGFRAMVTGGVGEEYSSALAQGANDDGLKSALEEQNAKLNKEMTELQFIISAYRMRVTPKECYQKTLEWIDWTDGLSNEIPRDTFGSAAKIAVSTHKAWLTDMLEQLKKEDESLQSELDKLKEQKDTLNEEKRKALDENDLNGAKKVDAKLEEIDKRIDEEVAKAADVTGDKNASASQKADASTGLTGTAEGAIQDIKKDALDKLSNGEDASDEMNALKDLGATDAIKEIEDAKKDASSDDNKKEDESEDEKKEDSEDANDTPDSSQSDDVSGSDSTSDSKIDRNSSNGKKSISKLSERELLALIEEVLGGPFESLSPSGKVVAAVALEWAGDVGNAKAKQMAKNFIEICVTEKNKYVYDTYLNGATVMVNLRTVGNVTDYRYIYKSAGKTGTLAKGTESYTFSAGSKEMKIEATKTSNKMTYAAALKYGTLYIPENTIREQFGLTAQSIKNAQYSAVLDGKMDTQAKELLEIFKNGGKE